MIIIIVIISGQCCVCNVGITLKELKPVRIEILNNTTKPKNGDVILV